METKKFTNGDPLCWRQADGPIDELKFDQKRKKNEVEAGASKTLRLSGAPSTRVDERMAPAIPRPLTADWIGDAIAHDLDHGLDLSARAVGAFEEGDIETLRKALGTCGRDLESLDLGGQCLNDAGVIELAKALNGCSNLRTLRLNDVQMTADS
jgi:hypothetical protein